MRMLPAESTLPDCVKGNRKSLQGQSLSVVSTESPAKHYCCYAVITVLTVAVIVLSVALSLPARKPEDDSNKKFFAACPRQWIGIGNQCYYFSDVMRNWTFSQIFCMAQGAQLARFDSQEELAFLMRYKGDFDYWIGLLRKSSQHAWMWTDNTEYKNVTSPRGQGECAYLVGNEISSGRNYIQRRWICSKPQSFTACVVPMQS
ncbi:C-type lectin domain family 2 member G isoform X1 [Mesocricetus auratus]|uniref:C-type lectin domain family 2 member G isoform X1 n=1 Tax=Mesocricetus auratus TaxID=10036 RepID=A0ABM2WRE9_MESAU|nr:C-type lectin domain family 2 member G isoform X1 [Mesocricetus auratus]XP_040593331.1 C-type lectin domain family 2 member G isoform X1 [Mesocricetus auratus]